MSYNLLIKIGNLNSSQLFSSLPFLLQLLQKLSLEHQSLSTNIK